jgi:hypothetical protein
MREHFCEDCRDERIQLNHLVGQRITKAQVNCDGPGTYTFEFEDGTVLSITSSGSDLTTTDATFTIPKHTKKM